MRACYQHHEDPVRLRMRTISSGEAWHKSWLLNSLTPQTRKDLMDLFNFFFLTRQSKLMNKPVSACKLSGLQAVTFLLCFRTTRVKVHRVSHLEIHLFDSHKGSHLTASNLEETFTVSTWWAHMQIFCSRTFAGRCTHDFTSCLGYKERLRYYILPNGSSCMMIIYSAY